MIDYNDLIELSDSDEEFETRLIESTTVESNTVKQQNKQIESIPDIRCVVIYSTELLTADERKIKFIDYCCSKEFFNDEHLNLENQFSIYETNLPDTYNMMAKNDKIKKKDFIDFFIRSGFTGDIQYIFNCIDLNNDRVIHWEEFFLFFYPYIKKIVTHEEI
jgi:mRNA-degrading endonuclease HigB of HigAB toxin-antitoxin module